MNLDDFQAHLAQGGYSATPRTMAPNASAADHSHAWDACALITDGDITLWVDGVATCYGVGDVFTLAANTVHQERAGPSGVAYLAGRRAAA